MTRINTLTTKDKTKRECSAFIYYRRTFSKLPQTFSLFLIEMIKFRVFLGKNKPKHAEKRNPYCLYPLYNVPNENGHSYMIPTWIVSSTTRRQEAL